MGLSLGKLIFILMHMLKKMPQKSLDNNRKHLKSISENRKVMLQSKKPY